MTSPGEPRWLRRARLLLALFRPLVPSGRRDRWRREWEAELWYAHRTGRPRLLRTLSAFPHALALRWQETRPDMLLVDFRYATRQLRRSPGFALLVIATLGIGIGANSLVYSVLQSTVMTPMDIPDADRVVYLWRNSSDSSMQIPPTMSEVEAWREQIQGLEEVFPLSTGTLTLTGRGEPRRLRSGSSTPGFFRFAGADVLQGRTFAANEEGGRGDRVAILTYGVWQQLFGGDESTLGSEILLDDEPYVVVGILPADFRLQTPFAGIDVWTPLGDVAEGRGVMTLARLAPGTSVEAVNAELEGLTRDADPDSTFGDWVGVARPPRTMVSGRYRTVLYSIQWTVLFVLLIAGANVANLLLARGSRHRRELAIRSAIGAARGHLVRQLLAESVLLALLGGLLGLGIAHGGVRLLRAVRPADLTYLETLRIDPSVLWATTGLSLACGLLFGLAPAWQACRGRLAADLTEGARTAGEPGGHRLRSGLVIVEVALCTLLLVGAGLLLHSFVRLQGVDPGFEPAGVLALRVSLPDYRYDEKDAARAWTEIESGVATALGPRLEGMAIAAGLPPSLGVLFGLPETEEGPLPADRVQQISASIWASPSYFETLRIPFLEGGPYPDDGGEDPHAVVINESFARKLWPDGSPVGRRLRFGGEEWLTVAGVVADTKVHGLDSSFTDQHVYNGYGWRSQTTNMLALRTDGDPLDLVESVRAQVRRVAPDAVISDIATLDEMLGDSIALQRFNAWIMAGFAALAILLAMIGIYGVLSYSVARRTGELGVRLALGAPAGRVLRLVTREGLVLVIGGLTLGLVGAIWLGQLLASQLYGVEALDPITFVVVALIFPAVGVAASAIPAWRAARVDPMTALRTD